MAMESMTPQRRASDSGDWRPVPDPTTLTDAAILKAISAQRDYIDAQLAIRDERLTGMDKATDLRLHTIEQMPARIDEKVGHLGNLVNERFASVGKQFSERDTRSEREARDNKLAVDAAFAAQEKQAAAQNKYQAEAIGKSELGTAETINKLEQLVKAGMDNLSGKIDDAKERIALVATTSNAVVNQKLGAKDDRTGLYATIGMIATVVLLVIAIIGFELARAAP